VKGRVGARGLIASQGWWKPDEMKCTEGHPGVGYLKTILGE